MRDDIYILDRSQRREARTRWRAVPYKERVEAVKRAKAGLPASDPVTGKEARDFAKYLLAKRWSNRIPRILLPVFGLIILIAGFFFWAGVALVWSEPAVGLGIFFVVGGGVVTLLGALSSAQRHEGHLIIDANPDLQP